jgi:hypothetical protein
MPRRCAGRCTNGLLRKRSFLKKRTKSYQPPLTLIQAKQGSASFEKRSKNFG